jgi:hypothetical protein
VSTAPQQRSEWDEPLVAPARSWAGALALSLLLAAAVHSGAGGLRAVLPYVVVPLLVLGVLVRASRGRVRVHDGVLHVPGARVPLEVLGAVRALDREQTRRLRGPAADLRAFVATRPWLSRAVQVRLEDPDDDTPYWLVGTRRPEELAAVLSAAVTAARAAPGGRAPGS